MAYFRYECDQCGHEDTLFWSREDEKTDGMCPNCWGLWRKMPPSRLQTHTFQEYVLDTPDGKKLHVNSASLDRDIPKMYGICKATSDEVGTIKKKPIKMRPFAEDYARHARIEVGA